MSCEKCGSATHRDDAMNRRCNGCEHLVRQCICETPVGPLPYVPPLKSSHECRVCRRWLEGEWSSASEEQRVEIQRQMDVGRCDDCTRSFAESA